MEQLIQLHTIEEKKEKWKVNAKVIKKLFNKDIMKDIRWWSLSFLFISFLHFSHEFWKGNVLF